MSQAPRPHIFIATHHKSGTVWMVSTFRRIAKANNFAFVHLNTGESGWNLRPDKLDYFEQQRTLAESDSDHPAIFVDYHSAIPDLASCKASRGANGIHLIRDPRDMLLSAVRYHLNSDEAWLHEPQADLGGLTHQQRLHQLDTLEDRIRFEIDQQMGWTIREMSRFDHQGVFRDVKYEDLVVDESMTLFHELCVGLGMRGGEFVRALESYWQLSIFGGMKAIAESGRHKHIRDSRAQQWRTQLSAEGLEIIQRAFEAEIVGLGYELADGGDLVYNASNPLEA
jgi:Sulfotransferase domain